MGGFYTEGRHGLPGRPEWGLGGHFGAPM